MTEKTRLENREVELELMKEIEAEKKFMTLRKLIKIMELNAMLEA